MHCPFTSEISLKRKHIISITVMRYFYFLMSAITCVGLAPLPPPPLPLPISRKNFPSVPVEAWHKRIFKPSKIESTCWLCPVCRSGLEGVGVSKALAKSSKIISLCLPWSRCLARSSRVMRSWWWLSSWFHPYCNFFSVLQLIEGLWQHFFSMRKCFMKLFWHLVFSDCCFAEPAIRQSFFSIVWESTELRHWGRQLETSPEVMSYDLVFARTFQSTGTVCVSWICSPFS